MFKSEVQTLVDNLKAGMQKVEVPTKVAEEEEKDDGFIHKIKVLDFESFKESVESKLLDPMFELNQDHMRDEQSLRVMSVQDQVFSFVKSIAQLHASREVGSRVFNKDDDLIIDFVSSAANIRAANFSIPTEVRYYFHNLKFQTRPSSRSRRWRERSYLPYQAQMRWLPRSKSLRGSSFSVGSISTFKALCIRE